MKNYLILSDIHGNLSAFDKVMETEPLEGFEGIILLGDLIDYGPRSNEVIDRIMQIPKKQIIINIWGNHEQAIVNGDDSRFSSERGKASAAYTRKNLTGKSFQFLQKNMEHSGMQEADILGQKCLAVHGSLTDPYWKSISHEETGANYAKYDFVFSGHSHIPHFFEHFYPSDCEEYRNKKRTVFLNPGSVGQPRNHNPCAHYAVLDMENLTVQMKAAAYEVEEEMRLFTDKVDNFYRERLKKGI